MVDITPAILPKSFADLEEHVLALKGEVKLIQVDVVDGNFARGKTWPYKDSGTFEKIVEDESGLPLWEEVSYEFDLMVEEPHTVIERYLQAGALRVILHAASRQVMEAIRIADDAREDSGAFPLQIGIALMPDSQPEELDQFEGRFDFVQVMGIKHVGRQGEPFEQQALYLLERLRRRNPELQLQVDGGVSLENARALAVAGANRLVAGSAIFGADDPSAALKALYTKANGN